MLGDVRWWRKRWSARNPGVQRARFRDDAASRVERMNVSLGVETMDRPTLCCLCSWHHIGCSFFVNPLAINGDDLHSAFRDPGIARGCLGLAARTNERLG